MIFLLPFGGIWTSSLEDSYKNESGVQKNLSTKTLVMGP